MPDVDLVMADVLKIVCGHHFNIVHVSGGGVCKAIAQWMQQWMQNEIGEQELSEAKS